MIVTLIIILSTTSDYSSSISALIRYLTPPPVPSLYVDSFMQPGYDTMLEQIRDFSSDDEDDDNDPVSSDPDSDDDLPIVDFTVQENVRSAYITLILA